MVGGSARCKCKVVVTFAMVAIIVVKWWRGVVMVVLVVVEVVVVVAGGGCGRYSCDFVENSTGQTAAIKFPKHYIL